MEAQKLLGRRIRSLRQAHGLTQQQLGEKAHLNYKYMGAVERGEENPSLVVLERIATGLDVDLLELFRFAHEESSPRILRRSLNRLLARADTGQLQLVYKVVNALLKRRALSLAFSAPALLITHGADNEKACF